MISEVDLPFDGEYKISGKLGDFKSLEERRIVGFILDLSNIVVLLQKLVNRNLELLTTLESESLLISWNPQTSLDLVDSSSIVKQTIQNFGLGNWSDYIIIT